MCGADAESEAQRGRRAPRRGQVERAQHAAPTAGRAPRNRDHSYIAFSKTGKNTSCSYSQTPRLTLSSVSVHHSSAKRPSPAFQGQRLHHVPTPFSAGEGRVFPAGEPHARADRAGAGSVQVGRAAGLAAACRCSDRSWASDDSRRATDQTPHAARGPPRPPRRPSLLPGNLVRRSGDSKLWTAGAVKGPRAAGLRGPSLPEPVCFAPPLDSSSQCG